METIIVTGTPCTGKTTLAKEIAKRQDLKFENGEKAYENSTS